MKRRRSRQDFFVSNWCHLISRLLVFPLFAQLQRYAFRSLNCFSVLKYPKVAQRPSNLGVCFGITELWKFPSRTMKLLSRKPFDLGQSFLCF